LPVVAHASVSIAALFNPLVAHAAAVAVVTPTEQRSLWEDGRILTYTRMRIDSSVAGSLASGGEAWVRTLGGIVGDVGQSVEGEAAFTVGRPSLLFLEPSGTGSFAVTARAQGQFVVVAEPSKPAFVRQNKSAGHVLSGKPSPAHLLGPDGLPVDGAAASAVLDGRSLEDAKRIIGAAFQKIHGR
jgi:hypothetical protein